MLIGSYLTLKEALGISITGFIVVFLTLISIAIFIKIISAVVGVVVKEEKKTAPAATPSSAPAKVVEGREDKGVIAAVIAAVSEEVGGSVEKFKIVSIEEKR